MNVQPKIEEVSSQNVVVPVALETSKMRKIRLSDTDVEFFDLEISPSEYMFYQKHKDAFRTMWKEQAKPFWTRFVITFRSYTVKIGVMKQMSVDSPKFENLIDQAFIFIHEQFVDGKVNMAKTFLEDVAKLAQNQDKFPALDSKSFARDPFYLRETRDLFRRFFGPPDQKSSYLKVYILCPVYLRFGGSVCRCLIRWIDSQLMSPGDDSYWVPPAPNTEKPSQYTSCHGGNHMCTSCMDDCGTKYFKEKICGGPEGPKFLDFWQLGDPRFNDKENPLYELKANRLSDWRDDLTVELFRDFFQYAKLRYGKEKDQCKECSDLRHNQDKMYRVCQDLTHKKKKKKKKNKQQKEKEAEKLEDLTEEQLSERLMEIVKRNTSLEGAYREAKELRNKINIIDSPKKKMETVSPEKAEKIDEAQIERGVFTSKAKVSDDFKCVMSRYEEGSKNNVISGFKVIKMEEESTGAKETTVKVVTRGSQEDADRKPKESEYPLNARMIRNKIEGLPEKLEWWEGVGWCIAVVNYEHEEKGLFKPPSNFTIKVTSPSEDAMKRTMLKLLYYVAKRKKRYSPSWCMDDDDIVACVLPDDSPDLAGLAVTIQRGFRFEERLTEEEKKTMTQRPYVGRKVLMTLEPGSASKMLQMDGGHENLRDLIDRVMEESGYHDDEGEQVLPLHHGTTLYIPGKGGTPILDVSGSQPADMHASSMWDQLLSNPEKFELFLMVDEDKVPEFKKHGLKIVDAETIWQSVCKTGERTCAYCNKQLEKCKCFGDKSRLDTVKDVQKEADQKTEKFEKTEQKPVGPVKKETEKEVTLAETSKAGNETKTTDSKATVKEDKAVEVTPLKTPNGLNVSEETNLKTADSIAAIEEEKAVEVTSLKTPDSKATIEEEKAEVTSLKTPDSLNVSEETNLKIADSKATVEEEKAVEVIPLKIPNTLNVSEEANFKTADSIAAIEEEKAVEFTSLKTPDSKATIEEEKAEVTSLKTPDSLNVSEETNLKIADSKATVEEEKAEVTSLKTPDSLNVSEETNLKTADSKATVEEEKAVEVIPLKIPNTLNVSEEANLKTADSIAAVEEEKAVEVTPLKTPNSLNVSEEANLKTAGPMVNVESVQDSSTGSQPSTEKGKESESTLQDLKYKAEEKGENVIMEQQKVENEEGRNAVEESLFMKGEQTIDKASSGITVERETGASFEMPPSKTSIMAEYLFQKVQSSAAIPLPYEPLSKTGMETSDLNADSVDQSTTSNEKTLSAEETVPKADHSFTSQSTDKEEEAPVGLNQNHKVQGQDGKKDFPSGTISTDDAVHLDKSINDKKTGQGKDVSMAQGLNLVVNTANITLAQPAIDIQIGKISPISISSEKDITSVTAKDDKTQNKNNSSAVEIPSDGSRVDKVPVPSEGTSVGKSSATNSPKSSELPKKTTPSTDSKKKSDPKLALPKGFRVHLNVVGDPSYKSKLEEMLEPYFAEKSTTTRQVLPNGTVITQMVYQSTFESDEESKNESDKTVSAVQSQQTANKKMESGPPSKMGKDTSVSEQENNVVKHKEKEEASGKELGQRTEINLLEKEGGERESGTGVELASLPSAKKTDRITPNGNVSDVTEESDQDKKKRTSPGVTGIEKQEISPSKDEGIPFTEMTKNGLRMCYSCKKQEPKRKMFKKCQKCKEENVRFARYYCKRECQIEDWNKRHKREHKEKLL